jgi:hypothetical protein
MSKRIYGLLQNYFLSISVRSFHRFLQAWAVARVSRAKYSDWMSGQRPLANLGGWPKNMAGLNIEGPLAVGSPT